MPFVLDASLAASWVLPDEKSALFALDTFQTDHALVPELWWFEIYSLLISAERRKRISLEKSNEAQAFFADLVIEVDHEAIGENIMALARKHDLTGYDATYLELAKRENLSLATLDAALIAAAPREGVVLLTAN